MNIVIGTLVEERQRNQRMQLNCIEEIDRLPRGSISIKKRGDKKYCYLKYRSGKKFISEYAGIYDEKFESLKEQVEKRKYFEQLLKSLKEERKTISMVVKDLG
jgi:fructose-1,6-bisphosphatase